MDIQVINVDPATRLVTFGLKPKVVTGISKLVQIVVLSLLNSTGKDVLDPGKGAGLPDMVGMNINPKDSTEVFAELAQRIKKAEQEIINDQLGSSDSSEEKLRELQILEIKEGNNIDEIFVRIRVINQENQISDIMV